MGGSLFQQHIEIHPRPQPRTERVPSLRVRHYHRRAEALFATVSNSGDDDLAALVGSLRQIAADDDLLFARRQVRQFFRIDPGDPQAFERHFQIPQSGPHHFVQQIRRDLGRRVRALHPPPCATADRRDCLQDAGFVATRWGHRMKRRAAVAAETLQAIREGDRIRVAGGDDAIADKYHLGLRLAFHTFTNGREGLIKIRPAKRRPRGNEIPRRRYRSSALHAVARFEPPHGVVTSRQFEPVVVTQRGQQGPDQRVLVRPRGGIHRARGIGDDHQMKRRAIRDQAAFALPPTFAARRRDESQKIAVLAAPMRDHHDRRGGRIERDVQLEVLVWRVFLRREFRLRRVRRMLDPRRMGPAGNAGDWQRRGHSNIDREFAQRVLPQHLALQRIAVTVTAVFQRQHLGIGNLHPFFRMGEDGEHPGLEDVAAGPFQQAGIAPLAQNRLVDFACPLLFDHIGLNQFAVDPHPEARDRGILRQGEVEHSL